MEETQPRIFITAVHNRSDTGRDDRRRNSSVINPLVNIRDRLYRTIFIRGALSYGRTFPSSVRRFIEFTVLLKALCSFIILTYMHIICSDTHGTCLENVKSIWPRDGILRVEILNDDLKVFNKTLNQSHYLNHHYFTSIPNEEKLNKIEPSTVFNVFSKDYENYQPKLMEVNISYKEESLEYVNLVGNVKEKLMKIDESSIRRKNKEIEAMFTVNEIFSNKNNPRMNNEYIVEYSLEYGLLRLSPKIRKKLNISVMIVKLDPSTDSCFGGSLSKFLLKELIGYEDLLKSSVKNFAKNENMKGYVKNVITGELYRLVNMCMLRSAYLGAYFFMTLFTISISLILRYLHHLLFVLMENILHMVEINSFCIFPAIAPFFITFLALISMLALLSEFFNDTTIALYIIFIVLIAEIYNTICCHSYITKKHWLKFFYIYYFSFFAYHYRFNGQYCSLALITSWFFIEHSMLYFFHHYELPIIQLFWQQITFRVSQNFSANTADDNNFHSSADNDVSDNNNASSSDRFQVANLSIR